jgi:phosphoribosylformylglycinamidine cyclo-ligase
MSDDLTYESSGVSIKTGEDTVNDIKSIVRSTFIPGVISDIGGFAGLFELGSYKNPVLVSGTDGVGTKLKIAIESGKYNTVGIDLVAMCVNDIIVNGAKPLFFLDYIGLGKLQKEDFSQIINGIARGCKIAGCALIGGETAEMPGMYSGKDFDLAGFSVGVVEKEDIIDGKTVGEDDSIIIIPSNGIHSNGYSLVRNLFYNNLKLKNNDYIPEFGSDLSEELLRPTRIYVDEVLKAVKTGGVHAMAHITGGGIAGNLSRVIPQNMDAIIIKDIIPVLPVFEYMKKYISESEMYKVFNMGAGFIIIGDKNKSQDICNITGGFVAGEIKKGSKEVKLV